MARIVFVGGNGHCTERLDRARAALGRRHRPLALAEALYPGFEDRPRAADLEAFLAAVHASVAAAATGDDPPLLYGTGIGGLLLLCLRSRGHWTTSPLLLQAPILWGLERRRLPALMRFAPLRKTLGALFAAPPFQAWFARRYFMRSLARSERTAFFRGYARCSALPDLFAWLGPPLLRHLEKAFEARPEGLERISIWWGGRDRVVGLDELRATEAALGVRWPVTTFSDWGHYPMIDAPEEWTAAIAAFLDGG